MSSSTSIRRRLPLDVRSHRLTNATMSNSMPIRSRIPRVVRRRRRLTNTSVSSSPSGLLSCPKNAGAVPMPSSSFLLSALPFSALSPRQRFCSIHRHKQPVKEYNTKIRAAKVTQIPLRSQVTALRWRLACSSCARRRSTLH